MNASGARTSIWWLNPCWILVAPLAILSCIAALIPEADYRLYWRMPKVFCAADVVLCLWVAGAFSMGCIAAVVLDRALRRPGTPPFANAVVPPRWTMLTRLFYLGLIITATAHLVWFALIVQETGFGILLGIFRGEAGRGYELIGLRQETAIPGITSLTQVGIGTTLLGVFLAVQLGWKPVRWPLVLLVSFAVVRAMFLGERLALIEVMLPSCALWLRLRGLRSLGRHSQFLMNLAPIAGACLLYVLFTFAESFRSWGYYSEHGESSLLWFSLVRLSGYYVTSLNNGALLWAELGDLGFPYSTLEWLWRFPLIGLALRESLGGLNDPSIMFKTIFTEDGNPEFNNPTGVFVTFLDFGVPGALVFWVLFGCAVMLLYRAFQRGSVAGLFLYPFIFMGLTDQVRIFYLAGGRTFAPWLFLFATVLIARRELAAAALGGRAVPVQISEQDAQDSSRAEN